MSKLTVFLARLLGLFIVVLVATLLLRGSAAVEAAADDEAVMLTYGILSLGLGLAMVLGHNIWSGGVLPVVVTLVGWLILVKGVALLLLPSDALMEFYAQMGYGAHFNLYLMPSLVIGLYLAWAGFAARTGK